MALIDDLRAMPIYGNAFSDRDLFALAHQIAADESLPIADRYAALLVMDRAMGETPPVVTDEQAMLLEVVHYIAETYGS
jgi:hypothetical protein